MSTSKSRYDGSSRASQDKLQQSAHLAGIADVFGRSAAQAEPVLTLQQSLLGGIVRSQQQEARRLARRDAGGHNKEDSPRVQQARERTARLQALVGDAVDKARLVGRIADTLGTPGSFAGYVYGESGAPAPDHDVQLHIADKAQGREVKSSAKTDADGYFRMTWATGKGGTVPNATDAGALAAELLMALAGDEAAQQRESSPPATATTEKETDGTVAGREVVSRVQVLSPRGALVFEDPTPPAFEKLSSEFRCYVVPVSAKAG